MLKNELDLKFYILGLELQSGLLISKTAQKTDKRIVVFNDAQIVRYFCFLDRLTMLK